MAEGGIESIKVLLQGFHSSLTNSVSQAKGALNQFNETGGVLQKRMTAANRSLKNFIPGALGVMFFGMAMQRVFTGLLKPIFDAYGMVDLFNSVLLVTFIPIMDILLPMILSLVEYFMNLSPETQKVIGVIVLLGAGIGILLGFLGQLALGIVSLLLIGPVFSAIGTFIIGIFSAISLPIIAVIAVIIGLVIGMKRAWDDNFMGMRDTVGNIMEGVKGYFHSVFKVLGGIVKVFIGTFTLDFDKMWEGVKQIFSGAIGVISNAFDVWYNSIKAIVTGILGLFSDLWDKIESITPDFIKNGLGKVSGAFKAVGNFFGGSFNDFVYRPGEKPIGIHPNDTLVGFKGDSPFGGGSTQVVVNNTFQGFNTDDLQRMLDDRDRRIVDEVRRLTNS